ncbi:A-kinase anchor protein 4-like [Heteronotia binoei]|uniref:A-kinase anchor protein 4-like n=1 Tax=Heteronotia binoei TaxID=13085 RepID=UPI00292F9377|nr:A-kinase anchor protein 4-like [Heteronotia binoei]
MAQGVDWLQSRAGMCKINLYSPDGQKDQERKVICFVDVSNLNAKDGNLDVTGQSTNISDPARDLDLANLKEKEVIVVKDKNNQISYNNTEGAVCLFKQGSAEDVNIVSWLSNDLQKYAVGFQHVLTPSGTLCKPNLFDSPKTHQASQNNNNTAPNASSGQTGNPEDLTCYANNLCSFVLDMTRKELKDKWESSGKFIRHTIGSHCPEGKPASSECDSSRPPKRDDPFQDSFRPGESFSDKSRKHDDGSSMSKHMMVFANQIASDVMLSFMKTMKVQKGKQTPSACAVLKEVFLKHSKEIVSDLIDSSMKNLHNITGALMTDSDFVGGLKKNLYILGTQKTTEILEAMVKRLFKLLSEDKARSQSLAIATFKSGTQSNQRSQGMQFASLKSETRSHGKDRGGGPGKPLPSGSRGPDQPASLDVYAKDLLLTALMQIQQHLVEKNRDSGPRESNTSSFGYIHRDTNRDRASGSPGSRQSPKSWEGKSDHHHPDLFKEKGSIILSLIQKILRDACLNADESSGDTNRAREPGYYLS